MRQTIDLIVRRRGLNELKSGMDILKSYLQKKVHEETLALWRVSLTSLISLLSHHMSHVYTHIICHMYIRSYHICTHSVHIVLLSHIHRMLTLLT